MWVLQGSDNTCDGVLVAWYTYAQGQSGRPMGLTTIDVRLDDVDISHIIQHKVFRTLFSGIWNLEYVVRPWSLTFDFESRDMGLSPRLEQAEEPWTRRLQLTSPVTTAVILVNRDSVFCSHQALGLAT